MKNCCSFSNKLYRTTCVSSMCLCSLIKIKVIFFSKLEDGLNRMDTTENGINGLQSNPESSLKLRAKGPK